MSAESAKASRAPGAATRPSRGMASSGPDAYVALLRGINVGRGNRVPMAALRALLEQLGCRHVSTLLNSGNAVFAAPAAFGAGAHVAIRDALEASLGVSVPVIVKSRRQFAAAVSANPEPGAEEPSRLLVAFAREARELESLSALSSLLAPGERLHVTRNAAYLHCAAGIADSRAAEALLGKLGRGVTTRNWATVLKIAAALWRVPLEDAG